MECHFHFYFSFFVYLWHWKTDLNFVFRFRRTLKRGLNFGFRIPFFALLWKEDLTLVFCFSFSHHFENGFEFRFRMTFANGSETNPEMNEVTYQDTTDSRAIAVDLVQFVTHSVVVEFIWHKAMAEEDTFFIFFTGEAEGRVERRIKKSQVIAERLSQMFGVIMLHLYCCNLTWLGIRLIFSGKACDERTCRSDCDRTLTSIILILFQLDLTGIHIVEEFGYSTEWPNRDGRFDLSYFRSECTLKVEGNPRSNAN